MNRTMRRKTLAAIGITAATALAGVLATGREATPDGNAAAAARPGAVATTTVANRLPTPLGPGRQKLAPGVHVLDLVARDHSGTGPASLPRILIDLPPGWFNYDGWGMNTGGGLPLMILSFWDVDQVYPTPCRWKGKRLVNPGSGVDALASALARQPLRRASTPRDVELGGFAGKYLRLSVPRQIDFAGCDEGYFETWTALGWGSDRFQQGPGQVDRIWILDVRGQRLVVDAAFMPQATNKDRGELDRIVHSIRFLQPAAKRTASSSAAATRSSQPSPPATSTSSPTGSPIAALTGSRSAVPDLAIVKVTVSDINDRGQIIGTLTRKAGSTRGFVWENGSLTVLGQGLYADAWRIDERGRIIGTSSSTSIAEQHPVLWEKGRMVDELGFAFVTAINERGLIIGGRRVPIANGYTSAPVVGSAPAVGESGSTRDLWGPTDGSAFSTAINNRGQVVGQSRGHAVLWQNGEITDLGPGMAIAINERGQIIGYSQWAPGSPQSAFFWEHGTRKGLGPGAPVAINERGQVAGYSQATPGGPQKAFLWQNGRRTSLGTLGGTWSYPTAISDRGQIVGNSGDERGVQQGFVWQHGTMTRLGSPTGDARTRAVAINEHNQIIGDNCYADCGNRGGPLAGSRFAVLWTLRGDGIDALQFLSRR